MTTISVIVPVYNAAAYLGRCLDSLLVQTFADFEIVIVNDGSGDHSGVICEKYARQDRRVRVFHTANRGVSSARNLGIDQAQGEWFVFVDADDLVGPKYLENLYSGVRTCPDMRSILVMAGIKTVQEGGGSQEEVVRLNSCHVERAQVGQCYLSSQLYIRRYVSAKLYNKRVVDEIDIRFHKDIRYGEDLIFFLEYLARVEALIIIDECDYSYFLRAGSGLSKSYSKIDCEYRFFLSFDKAVDALLESTPRTTEHRRVELGFLLRAISCLYRPTMKVERSKRLKWLREIATDQRAVLSATRGMRCWLLRHNLCGLLDFIYSSAYSLRYSVMSKPWAIFDHARHRWLPKHRRFYQRLNEAAARI